MIASSFRRQVRRGDSETCLLRREVEVPAGVRAVWYKPGALPRVIFHVGISSVGLNGLYALLGAGLRLVTLAGSDYLAVRRLEMKAEFARLILGDLDLAAITSPSGRRLA
jgi:hypothetical protein